MPHFRKRYLAEIIPSSIAFSPIVGILGHRQVGKTSLVERIAGKYITLDVKADRELARTQPGQFLSENHSDPLVIDECQKASVLFDEIKEWVRTHKKPGQFLLTGSVRFSSKKAIRESLTGRIIYHELIPFTVSEIEHRPLPNVIRTLIQAKDSASWIQARQRNRSVPASLLKAIRDYQKYGGLPGVFFVRNDKLRTQKIADQLQTILDRDLREIVKTSLSFSQLLEFAESLAKQEGQPISYTQLQRDTGVSAVSAKKLIVGFEAVFLIRLLKVEGGKKGWVFYWEDHAESRYFSGNKLDPSIYSSGFIYRNVRAEFFYQGEHHFRFFHYLTRHNTTVPIGLEWEGKYLGFLPILAVRPSHAELMAAQSFLKRYNDAKVLMIHSCAETALVSERIVLLPEAALF